MNKIEIKELINGNKLIHEFYLNDPYFGFHKKTMEAINNGTHILFQDDENNYFLNNCNYHESWNLLMPIVEKIESLNDYEFTITYDSESKYHTVKISNFYLSSNSKVKIEAVWKIIIEFIKWYNEQN